MWRRNEMSTITAEAADLINSTHQLVKGDLDITIDMDKLTKLSELAMDISQISTTFNGYINEISHILSHLSAGNMAVSFTKDINYQGDFLPIKNALHKIRHSLNSSFEEINLLSTEVDKLCTQVEDGALRMAKNASDETSLITNLTETIYHITEQTSNNAAHAKLAADSINDIASEAEAGRKLMDRMLTSIQKVQASSQDISSIISIISGLANQTKLLALNASIEAARAGEAGRGFSVVAVEVSKLAEKSAEAVKQTTQMIHNSIQIADESVVIAGNTANSFLNIRSSIGEATQLCSNIAKVSKVQAKDLENTSEIITNISGVVQNNAAYAQENYAEAANLAELSSQLKKVMNRFRLRNQESDLSVNNVEQNEVDTDFLKHLKDLLHKTSILDEVDSILEDILKNRKDFECMYVIDGHGYQLSHTVMNPEIFVEQDENFKPAMPGDYHGSKKYFCKAMKNKNEWYTSFEYISTATGGLCKTLSCSYEDSDMKTNIICIDLICRY